MGHYEACLQVSADQRDLTPDLGSHQAKAERPVLPCVPVEGSLAYQALCSNFSGAWECSENTQDLVNCKARVGPCRESINVDVPDTSCIRCSD